MFRLVSYSRCWRAPRVFSPPRRLYLTARYNSSLPRQPPKDEAPETESEPEVDPERHDQRTTTSTRNQCLFVGAVAIGAYSWAASKTNSETAEWLRRLPSGSAKTIAQARMAETVAKAQGWMDSVVRMTDNLPKIPRQVVREQFAGILNRYCSSDVLRVCWGICAVNGVVFLAWRVPQLAPLIKRHFLDYPLSNRAHTMLTCVFSHQSLIHLLFNCLALNSFGTAAGEYLHAQAGVESTGGNHFLAFFLTAGVLSSFASRRVTIFRYLAGRLSALPLPSLGASGAVYACVTLTALAYPHSNISMLLLPISIPIQYGVGGLMLVDAIGLLRGWRVLDHGAHLSGAMFGLAYYHLGPTLWRAMKE